MKQNQLQPITFAFSMRSAHTYTFIARLIRWYFVFTFVFAFVWHIISTQDSIKRILFASAAAIYVCAHHTSNDSNNFNSYFFLFVLIVMPNLIIKYISDLNEIVWNAILLTGCASFMLFFPLCHANQPNRRLNAMVIDWTWTQQNTWLY